MDRSDKNVAFDVHQATVVALVQDARGRTLAHTVLPTEERAIRQFVGGMRGRISVVLEEGTHAQWLHDLLVPVADRVVVCDRRGEPRRGNKSDLVDVNRLANRLRAGTLRAVYKGGAERAALRELTRAYR